VSAVLRPVAKTLIKSGLLVMDSAAGIVAQGKEELGELAAEARAEHRTSGARRE
jgi:hypothetical protein